MKAQWYLIHSSTIPADLFLLTEETGTGKDFRGKINEDFDQTLVALGSDYDAITTVDVPENTKFAGLLYGDGEHFDEYGSNSWGILGRMERAASDEVSIYGANGDLIANYDCGDNVPFVMPPEVFGLKCTPWWEGDFPWC